jgi:RNA polymerase sigma factor (sigma-70 family)
MTPSELARIISGSGLSAVTSAELPQVWQYLYEQHEAPIGRHVTRLLSNGRCFDPPDHSLDVRQETWSRASRSLHQCDRAPVSWLYRIATNASFDHLKRCVEERSSCLGEIDEEQEVRGVGNGRLRSPEELYIQRVILSRGLARLSDQQILVLELRVEGLSYEEIHELTGITSTKARQLIHRAKLILQGKS